MKQEEQSEAIQKALDIARAVQEAYEAAQKAYEEAVTNLEETIDPAITSVDLRGVDLRGHDVKSIVKLASKMAKDELNEFTQIHY